MFHKIIRIFLIIIVTTILLVGMARMSHVLVGKEAAGSTLRLAWRATDNKVRICQEYTEEQKRSIPIHMQMGGQCENHIVSYQLTVTVDGASVFKGRITPGGARGDHPLIVSENIRLLPGIHAVTIDYVPDAHPDFMKLVAEDSMPRFMVLEAALWRRKNLLVIWLPKV